MKKLTEEFNSISVKKGDMFEVELIGHAGAGYQWDVQVLSGEVTLLSNQFQRVAKSDATAIGGSLRQVFLFKADAEGTIELKASHRRRWKTNELPLASKILRIRVDK